MESPKVLVLMLFLALANISPLSAAARPVEGEIVLLSLDIARAGEASASFAGIDNEIHDVFDNLGRFQVIALPYHVGDADLAGFVSDMQRFKNGAPGTGETIRVDGQVLDPADVSRMAASRVIVAPSVVDVRITSDKEGRFAADVVTSFAFIAAGRPRPSVRISIDSHGEDKDETVALKEAIDAIPPRLTLEISRVPYLYANRGILDVRGSEVVLDLGRDDGVRRGDELLVTDGGKLPEKGLLIIREVGPVSSLATVVYSDSPPRVGDKILDLARVGTDSTLYVHTLLWQPGPAPGGSAPLVGLRQAFSRGFYALRPFVGIEVPFNLMAAGAPGVPINLYAGGEYDILMGRLQVVPRAALGLGAFTGLAGPSPDIISHAGGSLSVAASYLFTRDIKGEIETGWLSWTGFSGYSYAGAFLGGGFTVKY
ncbi:MAG: hypothetical protein ABSG17_16290 [Spirochaetia bacterium]|jgi:hypothetical protein